MGRITAIDKIISVYLHDGNKLKSLTQTSAIFTRTQRRPTAAADSGADGTERGNDPGRKAQLKFAAAVGGNACSERRRSAAAAAAATTAWRFHVLGGVGGPYSCRSALFAWRTLAAT